MSSSRHTQRCFLSIQPDADVLLAVDSWRQRSFPFLQRAVRVQNLHITLAFLGDVTDEQLERVASYLGEHPLQSIRLSLDDVGLWPDQGILWLAPTDIPESLQNLNKRCRLAARNGNIRVDKRLFKPHMTLARRVAAPPGSPLQPPSFQFTIDSLDLQESRLGPGGPTYTPLASWQLG